MKTGFIKRALRADGKGGLFLLCECGAEVSIPVIASMPMTYECRCGIVYDSKGWILPEGRLSDAC